MSQLIAIFCDIDDVCKVFEPIYTQRLLQSGQRQRQRQGQLSLSEIMTIIVSFHSSGYRDFKRGYPFSPGHFVSSITYRDGLTALPWKG